MFLFVLLLLFHDLVFSLLSEPHLIDLTSVSSATRLSVPIPPFNGWTLPRTAKVTSAGHLLLPRDATPPPSVSVDLGQRVQANVALLRCTQPASGETVDSARCLATLGFADGSSLMVTAALGASATLALRNGAERGGVESVGLKLIQNTEDTTFGIPELVLVTLDFIPLTPVKIPLDHDTIDAEFSLVTIDDTFPNYYCIVLPEVKNSFKPIEDSPHSLLSYVISPDVGVAAGAGQVWTLWEGADGTSLTHCARKDSGDIDSYSYVTFVPSAPSLLGAVATMHQLLPDRYGRRGGRPATGLLISPEPRPWRGLPEDLDDDVLVSMDCAGMGQVVNARGWEYEDEDGTDVREGALALVDPTWVRAPVAAGEGDFSATLGECASGDKLCKFASNYAAKAATGEVKHDACVEDKDASAGETYFCGEERRRALVVDDPEEYEDDTVVYLGVNASSKAADEVVSLKPSWPELTGVVTRHSIFEDTRPDGSLLHHLDAWDGHKLQPYNLSSASVLDVASHLGPGMSVIHTTTMAELSFYVGMGDAIVLQAPCFTPTGGWAVDSSHAVAHARNVAGSFPLYFSETTAAGARANGVQSLEALYAVSLFLNAAPAAADDLARGLVDSSSLRDYAEYLHHQHFAGFDMLLMAEYAPSDQLYTSDPDTLVNRYCVMSELEPGATLACYVVVLMAPHPATVTVFVPLAAKKVHVTADVSVSDGLTTSNYIKLTSKLYLPAVVILREMTSTETVFKRTVLIMLIVIAVAAAGVAIGSAGVAVLFLVRKRPKKGRRGGRRHQPLQPEEGEVELGPGGCSPPASAPRHDDFTNFTNSIMNAL